VVGVDEEEAVMELPIYIKSQHHYSYG